jgi:hypothetical protein
MNEKERDKSGAATPGGKIQGEGDYDASRRYREEVGEFLGKADVTKLAREAAPKSAQEAREMSLAQESGERRSKGDDPADVKAMYPGQKSGS